RGARGDLERALALEGPQVLLGRVHRAEAHALGDFRAGRRKTGHFGQLADQPQDFALAFGQRFAHAPLRATVPLSSAGIISSIEKRANQRFSGSISSGTSLRALLTARLTRRIAIALSGQGARRPSLPASQPA